MRLRTEVKTKMEDGVKRYSFKSFKSFISSMPDDLLIVMHKQKLSQTKRRILVEELKSRGLIKTNNFKKLLFKITTIIIVIVILNILNLIILSSFLLLLIPFTIVKHFIDTIIKDDV